MLPFHDVTNLFPLLEGTAFAALKADLAAHGQYEPIWTYQGQIIDGRNRYRACLALGREPRLCEWDGQGSLVAFVLSLNLHRRHLDESQRAMVAARVKPLLEAEARQRQRGGPGGVLLPPNSEEATGEAAAQAARLLNVGRNSVYQAQTVLRDGHEALRHGVEAGVVSVSAAADITELDRSEQAVLVARGEAEILARAKEIRLRRQEERRTARLSRLKGLAEVPFPDGTFCYPVILADPPWRYEHSESESRAIENNYPTLALDQICALVVSRCATADAVLFLWATAPKLAEAMQVIEAWEFTYRSCAVWVKDRLGMGYWWRQRHELLLTAMRGNPPTPAPADRFDSVVIEPRGTHSAKPERFYEIIETMYPELPKLELFARTRRPGWAAWGNEVRSESA